MTFWERFYELCAEIGKKPNPVGKEIGVSSGVISKWKSGGIPNGENLILLSDYFGVSTDYLLGRAEKQQEEQQIAPTETDESDSNKQRLLRNYDDMNESAQEHLADYSDFMVSNVNNLKSDIQDNKMNA